MHISEYMCSSCLKNFDVLELAGRASFMKGCPHCGGRELKFKFDRFETLAAGKHLEPEPDDDPEDEDLDEDEELEEDDDEVEEDDTHGPAELN